MLSTMSLDLIVKGRRSIRTFSGKIPPDDLINEVLESVRYVPSPVNSQPLELVVIRSEQKRVELKKILEEEYDNLLVKFLAKGEERQVKLLKSYWRFTLTMFNAPVIIAAGIKRYKKITDVMLPEQRDLNRSGEIYLGASIYGITLSAHAQGLGSCIYTSAISILEKNDILYELLKIKTSAFITLGYPDEKPEQLYKKELKDMVSYI